MSEILLEVSQLCARYGKVEALHNIQLQLQRGNIATVIGPNGAGKSTLLNAIIGRIAVTRTDSLSRPGDRTHFAGATGTERYRTGAGTARIVFQHVGGRQLAARRFRACVSVIRNRSINWRRFSNYSRASRNDAPNWPAPCPAASGKCWPSAAH